MKRSREYKYRQKIINYRHMNKSKQKCLDKIVQNYDVTYYDMYQFYVKRNSSYIEDVINKIVERKMEDTFKSFCNVSELPLDLFKPINTFGIDKRPYYLGVDFAEGNDWTGKIMFNGKENR